MSETVNKFKIQVFNSSDPQAQYDVITVKDQKTLYLLDMADGTAKAYLGYKPLAGGGSNTIMGRLRETVFDAETATKDNDLWGANANITTIEGHKYYTFLSPNNGGATASNPLYSTIMLSKPLAGFDELVLTINNTGLAEIKIPVSHLLHGDWCGIIQDDFASGIPTDVSYEYNETDRPKLKFRMRSTLVINITTIEVVKYQEARVGKKRYKLISAPVEGIPNSTTADTLENCKEVILSNIFTDYDEIEFVIEAYNTSASNILKNVYTPDELLTKSITETEDTNITFAMSLIAGMSSGGDVIFAVDRASKKKLYFYFDGNITNARILAINGIKYETVTSDPITESYLRTLIDDIVSSKYVEYSIDNGTTQENESVPVTNES